MGEYRRFVAYVYEYRKGKKEENCGFVKVESWGERCTMELHLQCPGILAGTECKSYAFVREEKKMRGILLGSCKTEANGVSHILETSPRNIGGQRVALEDPSLEVNTIFFRRSNYIKHLTNALKQGFFYFPKYLQNYFLRVIIMALVALYQK